MVHGAQNIASQAGVAQLIGGLPQKVLPVHADLFAQHGAHGVCDLLDGHIPDVPAAVALAADAEFGVAIRVLGLAPAEFALGLDGGGELHPGNEPHHRVGFIDAGKEEFSDGIIYTPMKRIIG